IEQLRATQEIRQLKARYFRGVDQADGALVRSVLAEHCVLDYRGCCTDPATARDFLPAMNVVLRGRDAWVADGMARFGIVSVHQGHDFELTFTGETTADGIWSMTDRLWFPPGGAFATMTGYGHYIESYIKEPDGWKIQTTHVTRIRVEAA
ncbi:MAG: nuclear transport factor 2 family protein, partial [Sphingomonas sp.]